MCKTHSINQLLCKRCNRDRYYYYYNCFIIKICSGKRTEMSFGHEILIKVGKSRNFSAWLRFQTFLFTELKIQSNERTRQWNCYSLKRVETFSQKKWNSVEGWEAGRSRPTRPRPRTTSPRRASVTALNSHLLELGSQTQIDSCWSRIRLKERSRGPDLKNEKVTFEF